MSKVAYTFCQLSVLIETSVRYVYKLSLTCLLLAIYLVS